MGRRGAPDADHRAMLPARRRIEAHGTGRGLMYHAVWRDGQPDDLAAVQAPRAVL